MKRKRNFAKQMRQLVPWLLSLLVILWSVQTAAGPNASPASSKKKITSKDLSLEPDERLLERGDVAPFFGILVPEKKYSMKEQDLAACEVIKEGYVMCSESEPESGWDKFLYGAFAGGAAALAFALWAHK